MNKYAFRNQAILEVHHPIIYSDENIKIPCMSKLREFFKKEEPWYFAFIRDFLISLLVIGVIITGLYLYTGIWPPMVAVESSSMSPNIKKGSVVVIKQPNDIITYQEGEQVPYKSQNRYGDVIVYDIPKDNKRPIIHRAMYWVGEGDPMWENGPPAPYSGYITKGDNNNLYDQETEVIAKNMPIKPEWIKGKAVLKIPMLGWLRLSLDDARSGIHHYQKDFQYQCIQ
ncbi:MAG: Signal peptidase I LepB [Candidatus Methanohalarchaeum thermophilum]|uniref:Signal peptidase I LepB n=1 Tax=Methanohalarchaeum thermophilum TaxID=1903181 RepID=A0A1Q6DTL2_METT1|nr:MAG: Signal peptidase I LepB [Candidatus Methanohalarchaeum thermophilum]